MPLDSSSQKFDHCIEPDHLGQRTLLGIRVDRVSFDWALEKLAHAVIGLQGTAVKVAFMNVHNVNVAIDDSNYLRCLDEFNYVFPDGVGLQVASLLQGRRLPSNISGTDLIPRLLCHADLRGIKVFLLGHQPNKMHRVANYFTQEFPSLVLVGCQHGFFLPDDNQMVIDQINKSGADLLLIGMGSPRQEKWLLCNSGQLQPKLQITVGGLFQYWDGTLTRAPWVARKLGLEWLCILYQQHHKWRRYLIGSPLFLLRVINRKLQIKIPRN